MCCAAQNKAYSRNWLVRGRIRVQLKQEDGTLTNPEITNRECLPPATRSDGILRCLSHFLEVQAVQ